MSNPNNEYYAISKCCKSKSIRLPYSLESLILKANPEYRCCNCGNSCEVDLVPVWKEVSKGIFRKTELTVSE